jgi:hypothetical protein
LLWWFGSVNSRVSEIWEGWAMAGRTRAVLGTDLAQGAARFADWRRHREVGARIPAALWELAVELAQRHGLSPEAWLPWNYRETLATASPETAAVPAASTC